MKTDIFGKILTFKENRASYTPEEREKIKSSLKKQLGARLKTINSIISRSIDDINDF